MFFIISKLLVTFISPLTWIILLPVIALISKDPKKRLRLFFVSFVLLLIFTNPILLDMVASKWDIKPVSVSSLPKSDCAIVLGGFASEDYIHEGYFNSASDRFLQGLKLKTAGITKNILITGGNSDLIPTGFREADWVRKQLTEFKISEVNVIIENHSRNSIENAQLSKKILDSLHLSSPFILITSAYHMRRSLFVFKKIGLDVIPFPCNYIAGRSPFSMSQFIPEAGILGGWNFYIKEMIGYVVYRIKAG